MNWPHFVLFVKYYRNSVHVIWKISLESLVAEMVSLPAWWGRSEAAGGGGVPVTGETARSAVKPVVLRLPSWAEGWHCQRSKRRYWELYSVQSGRTAAGWFTWWARPSRPTASLLPPLKRWVLNPLFHKRKVLLAKRLKTLKWSVKCRKKQKVLQHLFGNFSF